MILDTLVWLLVCQMCFPLIEKNENRFCFFVLNSLSYSSLQPLSATLARCLNYFMIVPGMTIFAKCHHITSTQQWDFFAFYFKINNFCLYKLLPFHYKWLTVGIYIFFEYNTVKNLSKNTVHCPLLHILTLEHQFRHYILKDHWVEIFYDVASRI